MTEKEKINKVLYLIKKADIKNRCVFSDEAYKWMLDWKLSSIIDEVVNLTKLLYEIRKVLSEKQDDTELSRTRSNKQITGDNDFILFDRKEKIKSVIKKYGEQNFYISFSGGKDSCVLSELIDMAIPGNNIPRVYADTGIELNMVKDFVLSKQANDDRIKIIKPSVPIKKMLEDEGYPFKSKEHSKYVDTFQRNGRTQTIENYLGSDKKDKKLFMTCPKILQQQFTDDYELRISDRCCFKLKEEPLQRWCEDNDKKYGITGILRDEKGRRVKAKCLSFKDGRLRNFQPLAVVPIEWENWFIDNYSIDICDIYKEPYNFPRTGCKGCPFSIEIQKELDTLEKYFPNEKKQCEEIWEPVYSEYRRLGYRLKSRK